MNILLRKEWRNLRQKIEDKRNNGKFDALIFSEIVIEHIRNFDVYNDKKIKMNYVKNLKFFENLNIQEYNFKTKWYNFDNMLNNYVFEILDKESDRFIDIIRDSLTEILIYKSNIPSPEGPYYYRVYSDLKKEKIYYISDFIGEAFDINLEEIKIKERVIPAPAYLIDKYNIECCEEFENYVWKRHSN